MESIFINSLEGKSINKLNEEIKQFIDYKNEFSLSDAHSEDEKKSMGQVYSYFISIREKRRDYLALGYTNANPITPPKFEKANNRSNTKICKCSSCTFSCSTEFTQDS